jgi:uncharacterized protein
MRRAVKEPSHAVGRSQELSFKLDELSPPKQLDLELEESYLSGLLEAAESDFRAQGLGHLIGQLAAVDDGALLRAELRCRVVAACNRCLAPVTEELAFPVLVRYVPRSKLEARVERPKDNPGAEKAGSFDPRDLDEEPLDKQRVELQPAIREQLLLALPMGLVCQEDCKGLCSSCGQPLNEGACGCKPSSVDSPWARLRELKLKN